MWLGPVWVYCCFSERVAFFLELAVRRWRRHASYRWRWGLLALLWLGVPHRQRVSADGQPPRCTCWAPPGAAQPWAADRLSV